MKRLPCLILLILIFTSSLLLVCCSPDEQSQPTLPTPTGIRFENGSILWDSVEGATNGYQIKVVGDNYDQTFVVDDTLLTVDTLPDGQYTITVWAKSTSTHKLSQSTCVVNVVNSAAKVLPKLDSVTGVVYDDNVLSWNQVPNATNGYKVAIYSGADVVVDVVCQDTHVDVRTLEAGTYTAYLSAIAVSGEHLASDVTQKSFTVEAQLNTSVLPPMDCVTGIGYNESKDTIVWNEVEGNNGYIAEVYQDGVCVLKYDGIKPTFSFSSLGKGTYVINVITCGNGITHNDSEVATLNLELKSNGTLEAPKGVKIQNGFLTWGVRNNVSDVIIEAYDYVTDEQLEITPRFYSKNMVYLADIGLPDGVYNFDVKFVSNRYDEEISPATRLSILIESAVQFSAAEISNFIGDAPIGEHGAVKLITVDGVQYAEVSPTVDGWGRVASPEFSINFDKNPVCFMEVGYVFGGYHLQLQTPDAPYYVIRDTNKTGNANADLVTTTGLEGIVDQIRLRIGVNDSTSESANDARVWYRTLKVCYISELVEPEPTTLDAPRNLTVKNGRLTWSAPEKNEQVNAYGVTIKNSDGEVIYSDTLQARSIDLMGYEEGIYTVEITSKNRLFPTIITESSAQTIQFRVKYAARYTAEDLDTTSGSFKSYTDSENEIEATFDGEITHFNSTNNSSWGYIGPKTGITINMEKDPVAIIRTAAMQGGYFIKYSHSNSNGVKNLVGNTSVQYEGDKNLMHHLNNGVDGGISGIVSNYKFMLGCLGQADSSYRTICSGLIYGIDIIYIEEFIPLEIPDEPEKLTVANDFKFSGNIISASQHVGNDEYVPTYDIQLLDGQQVVAEVKGNLSLSFDVGGLDLQSGKTYTLAVKANGDGVYYSDSDWKNVQIAFDSVVNITDFTNVNVSQRESNFEVVSKDENGLVFRVPRDWGLGAIEIPVQGLTKDSTLVIEYGEVTGGRVTIAGRYYTGASGSGFTYDLGGDHSIESNQIETFKNLDRISGNTFWLGIGMGGGSGSRTVHIKAIRIVGWKVLEV